MGLIFLPVVWVFLLPGRLQLWYNYMFPGDAAQAFASERQRESSALLVWCSVKFWTFYLSLAFIGMGLLYLILQQQVLVSPPNAPFLSPAWFRVYLWLDSSWWAKTSAHTIVKTVRYIGRIYRDYVAIPAHEEAVASGKYQ